MLRQMPTSFHFVVCIARCKGGSFASGGDGPWSAGPNCHFASKLSLSRSLFVLCSCNFVKMGECHSHLPFACHLLAVRFKTSSRTLPSSRLKWRFSARRWVLRMARTRWYAYCSGHVCLRGSALGRQIRNGDQHLCTVRATQKALRHRSISQRTCVAASTCVSS